MGKRGFAPCRVPNCVPFVASKRKEYLSGFLVNKLNKTSNTTMAVNICILPIATLYDIHKVAK